MHKKLDLFSAVENVPVVGDVVKHLMVVEGFDGFQYEVNSLPHIGYGTLLPLTEKEAENLLVSRFIEMSEELHRSGLLKKIKNVVALQVVLEMCYQMGVPNLKTFKKFFGCLNNEDYIGASEEMLDSLWAKQTPDRAKTLSLIVKDLQKV